MIKQIYDTENFRSWSELINFYRQGLEKDNNKWKNWLFRGMQSDRWELKSSLERAVERAVIEDNRPAAMVKVEKGILRRFKRQVHHYISDVPKDDAWMEWQALMQHFGAPTRLLDWTYSFFVATYFAIENMEPDHTCSIWAFDSSWWYARAESLLDDEAIGLIFKDPNTKDPKTVKAILDRKEPIALVFPINSDRLNERLAIQQGAFLAPGDVSKSFIANMTATAGNLDASTRLLKINLTLNLAELERAIRDLHSMNINRATLFPGLDGFSTHFKNLILMPDEIATLGERLKGPG